MHFSNDVRAICNTAGRITIFSKRFYVKRELELGISKDTNPIGNPAL